MNKMTAILFPALLAVVILSGWAGYSIKEHQVADSRSNALIDYALKARLSNAMGGWCTEISDLYILSSVVADSLVDKSKENRTIINTMKQVNPRLVIAYELVQDGWQQSDFNKLEEHCLENLYQRGMIRALDYKYAQHEAGHLLLHALLDINRLEISSSINPRIESPAHMNSNRSNIIDEYEKPVIEMLIFLAGKASTDGKWTTYTETLEHGEECKISLKDYCGDIDAWLHHAKEYIECDEAYTCNDELQALYAEQVRWLKDTIQKHDAVIKNISDALIYYRELNTSQIIDILQGVRLPTLPAWRQKRAEL